VPRAAFALAALLMGIIGIRILPAIGALAALLRLFLAATVHLDTSSNICILKR